MTVDVGASLAPAFWALAVVLVGTAAVILAGRERPGASRRPPPWSRARARLRDST